MHWTLMDRLQSDNATIADACEEWLSLLRADALKPHLMTVMQCFTETVTHLKLHPEHPEVIVDLCAFIAGSDPFPASLLSSACVDWMSPVAWWMSVANCKCTVSPPLISTELKLHLPSSSTATEWVFSNFGLVQSKLRNQLGLEKAAKLVTCDMLQTAAWKCWTELVWKLKWTLEWTRTDYEIFRRQSWI